jgi:hypothetical protein
VRPSRDNPLENGFFGTKGEKAPKKITKKKRPAPQQAFSMSSI